MRSFLNICSHVMIFMSLCTKMNGFSFLRSINPYPLGSSTVVGRDPLKGSSPRSSRSFSPLFVGGVGNEKVSGYPSLPSSTLVLKHPETQTTLYIVGCVHGSKASEEDVTSVINDFDAKVVVLELCESRYQSLAEQEEKDRLRKSLMVEEKSGGNHNNHAAESFAESLKAFSENLQDFYKSYGILQTLLVSLLSSSAEVQRLLSFGQSSCEFRTSVALAREKNARVILGDQDLSVTLTRFKDGWRLPYELEELGMELASIRDAFFGPLDLKYDRKINVFRLLFTQERYIREVLKMVLPTGLLVLGTLEALEQIGTATWSSLSLSDTGLVQHVLALLFGPPAAVDLTSAAVEGSIISGTTTATALENVVYGMVNAFMVAYLLIINRYILVERDLFLAESIAQACQENPGKNVAAVVGLLHGNGIARHLRQRGFELVDRNNASS